MRPLRLPQGEREQPVTRLAGKSASVTGAASGLGRAIALRFAAEGARVAVADIDAAGGRDVAAAIGGAVLFLAHDVTSEAEWIANLARAAAAFGRLDILVNNAGIGPSGSIEKTTLEEWRRGHPRQLRRGFFRRQTSVPPLPAGRRGAHLQPSP